MITDFSLILPRDSERIVFYVAQPYTKLWKFKAYSLAAEFKKQIMERGHIVFSPILHSHALDGALSFEDFMREDLGMIDIFISSPLVKKFVFVMFPGWRSSRGCNLEFSRVSNAMEYYESKIVFLEIKNLDAPDLNDLFDEVERR